MDVRNRANVLVGAPNVNASGGVLLGEVVVDTAKYPIDAVTPLDEALGMKPAGFISGDGITKTVNRETEKIKDWNADTVIVVETNHEVILKLKFLESANAEVLKAVNPVGAVEVDGGKITIKDSAGMLPHKMYCFEMNGGAGKYARLFIPDGQVTNVGDIVYKKSGVIEYEVTIECFADKNNVKVYFFADTDGAVSGEAANAAARVVTLPAGVSGGTWSITVDGHTAEALAYNADGAAVQSAVQATGASDVTVAGSAGGPYTVTGARRVTANGEALTGGGSTSISVA